MARQPEGSPVQRALLEQYEYDGIQTCAADGTCQIACPLGIDTGKLVKGFREREQTPQRAAQAAQAAQRFAAREHSPGRGCGPGRGPAWAPSAAPTTLPGAADRGARADLAAQHAAARAGRAARDACDGAAAVYMPACVNRIFGASRGRWGLQPARGDGGRVGQGRHAGVDPG